MEEDYDIQLSFLLCDRRRGNIDVYTEWSGTNKTKVF